MEGPMQPSRIALTGFMGAGKSSCGALLADRLGWRFCDVDTLIETEAGMKVAEIFARFGEAEFREHEANAIAELLKEDGIVIALGGGAIESAGTRERLKRPGTVLVHLEVSLEKALARCLGSEATRPVLADQENLAARYNRRLPLYREADINIQVDALTKPAVVDALLKKIEELN